MGEKEGNVFCFLHSPYRDGTCRRVPCPGIEPGCLSLHGKMPNQLSYTGQGSIV